MCITTKNARRSQVWAKFLEERLAGRRPVLLDSAGGFSYVCIPAKKQPAVDEGLRFLESMQVQKSVRAHKGKNFGGPGFVGGWVGFFTYDFCAELFGVALKKNLKIPKMVFVWCNEVYAFKVTKEDGLKSLINGDFFVKNFKAGITKKEYSSAFKKIQKFLSDGENYQINFAQEFVGDFSGDPFALYRLLFAKNPSAMCFYMEGEWGAVCSNSPERLFSLRNSARGGILRTEPIKGTVPANKNPKFLLKDKKSYAELTMIVDLMRNDLARVSRIGSVKVLKHQALMKLKNVWHTYSIIESILASGASVRDVLLALLPGGSVTGCPKKRTIEAIDKLENFSRGAYCGSAGYVSINGNADFNIMIRTATITGAQISFPSGGGIVVDSTCEGEYKETIQKSKIMQDATRSL